MIYLFVSIICSVAVGVLFKFIKERTSVNIFLIAVNYLCAIFASYFSFSPPLKMELLTGSPLVISLSVLLPLVFILLTLSIRYSGIIKTDIAQRISLIIPITCAFWLFNEAIPALRWLGIITGFFAMALILSKTSQAHDTKYIFLVLVFAGYGVIDVLFKLLALQKTIAYTTLLFYIFCGSFIVSVILSLITLWRRKLKLQPNTFLYGLILGVLNFLNIYFYLKAHQYFSQNPTTVFATMNFGVILLGTLVGAWYFKEKLSAKNKWGLLMAVIAIGIVVWSQLE